MNIGVKPDEQTKLYDEIGKLTGWEREQTNKEWIQSATTEQLADVLSDYYLMGVSHGINGMDITPRTKFVEWLKQPRTQKELKMTEEQVAKVFEVATEDLRQKRKATNKDWLNSMSAEDFADWLTDTFDLCGAGCSNCFVKDLCLTEENGDYKTKEEMIAEWLMKPHDKDS